MNEEIFDLSVVSGQRLAIRERGGKETVPILKLLSVFVRVSSCDFVDRLVCPRDRAIHEITRTRTNEALRPTRVLIQSPQLAVNVNSNYPSLPLRVPKQRHLTTDRGQVTNTKERRTSTWETY
jgi:hypothetical protein